MFCYPLLGLLPGVNVTLTIYILLALVIPYSGNSNVRCDPGVSLDTFYINIFDTFYKNKCYFCYPFLPHLGVLSRVNATLRVLPLVIPYSETRRYDITLVLASQFFYPILLPLLGCGQG